VTTDIHPWHPAFDHAEARSAALAVLNQVSNSIGPATRTTSIGLDSVYAVRVQFDPDEFEAAKRIAFKWTKNQPVVRDNDDQRHHWWTFDVGSVRVEIVAVTMDGPGSVAS